MTEQCDYCGDSVAEDDYLAHLQAEHYDDLSSIDRRRIDEPGPSDRRTNRSRYAIGIALIGLFGAAYLAIFLGGIGNDGSVTSGTSSAAIQPDTDDRVHVHGTIELTIDGDPVDFSQPEYVEQDGCFHFHGEDADDGIWHVHCGNVSLEYALGTLGIDATADRIEIDGETYDNDDPDTSVSITVDGEPVDPVSYVLEGVGPIDQAQDGAGDDVRIVVESEDSEA